MNEVIENNGANNVEVEEGTPAAKAEETKAGKFIRLGECRMNKAIDAIGRCKSKIYGNENKGKCNFFLWDKGRVGRIRRWVSHRHFRRKVDDNKIPDDLHNGGGNRQRDCKK